MSYFCDRTCLILPFFLSQQARIVIQSIMMRQEIFCPVAVKFVTSTPVGDRVRQEIIFLLKPDFLKNKKVKPLFWKCPVVLSQLCVFYAKPPLFVRRVIRLFNVFKSSADSFHARWNLS